MKKGGRVKKSLLLSSNNGRQEINRGEAIKNFIYTIIKRILNWEQNLIGSQ